MSKHLHANPADVRAAWRAAFQAEPKPRLGFVSFLGGTLLGGLITALIILVGVPLIQDIVNSKQAQEQKSVATDAVSAVSGTLTLEFVPSSMVMLESGNVLGLPVEVIVKKNPADHDGVPDELVSFRVESVEGNPDVQIEPVQTHTDTNGRASVRLIPGGASGKANLVATLAGKDYRLPLEVRAPAVVNPTPTSTQPPLIITKLVFEPDMIDLGQVAEPVPVTVKAVTSDGTAVPDQMITLSTGGNGTVAPNPVVTGPDGAAQFTYTPAKLVQAGAITAVSGEANGRLELSMPEPVAMQITLDPPAFDVGVKQQSSVRVRVATVDGAAPAADAEVTLHVEPEGLATIGGQSNYTGRTDANGELTADLAFGATVGEGKLVVSLGEDTPVEAAVIVRPIAVSGAGKNVRAKPDTSVDNTIATTKEGDQGVILGRDDASAWWYVRLPDGQLGWLSSLTKPTVIGDTSNVPIIDPETGAPRPAASPTPTEAPTPTPSPTLSPTLAPTVTPSPTPVPKATATPAAAIATPTPPAAQPGAYPKPGRYAIAVPAGAQTVALYRWGGGTAEKDKLAEAPAGGEVEVVDLKNVSGDELRPPPGYVLVEVAFWVQKDLVVQESGTYKLKAPRNDTELLYWKVQDGTPQDALGSLLPYDKPYGAGQKKPEESGDWRRVTVRVWIALEHIGTPVSP